MNNHATRNSALLIIISMAVTIAVSVSTIRAGFVVSAQETRHLGKWEGTDNAGETASISFEKDGYVVLYRSGETLGDKRDREPLLKYEFDYSKTPIWLDFVIYDLQGKEHGRMKSIVKFLADDKMVWRISENQSERPADFDEKDKESTIVLKRVSKPGQ